MIKLMSTKLVYYSCPKNKITVVIKMESGKIHSLKYISLYIKGERMNNKERDEKFLKSWLKKENQYNNFDGC